MEYVKGKPYFCFCDQKIKAYPYLDRDIKCDILIIGGGIDGAIANFYLSKKFDVVLVDKSRLGMACTACATALLEYQLDDYASDLLKVLSKESIVLAYNMGLGAIDKIERFIEMHGNHCNFARRPTFLFSNSIFSIKKSEEEYEFRQKNGLIVSCLIKIAIPFHFQSKGESLPKMEVVSLILICLQSK